MKKLLNLFAVLLIAWQASGQTPLNLYYVNGSMSIGQGSKVYADSSAWLQIGKDTTKRGVIMPHVILDSISTTKRGLFVYNLADSVLYHFDGTKKVRYLTNKDTTLIRAIAPGGSGGSSDWSSITSKPTTISGYGITDAWKFGPQATGAIKKIGSSDNYGIEFWTNNVQRARFDTGNSFTLQGIRPISFNTNYGAFYLTADPSGYAEGMLTKFTDGTSAGGFGQFGTNGTASGFQYYFIGGASSADFWTKAAVIIAKQTVDQTKFYLGADGNLTLGNGQTSLGYNLGVAGTLGVNGTSTLNNTTTITGANSNNLIIRRSLNNLIGLNAAYFQLWNASNAYVNYASAGGVIIANTTGAHSGGFAIQTANAGVLDSKLYVQNDGATIIQNGGTFTKTTGVMLDISGGRTRVRGGGEESLMELSNDKTFKWVMGVGRGVMESTGMPFLAVSNGSGFIVSSVRFEGMDLGSAETRFSVKNVKALGIISPSGTIPEMFLQQQGKTASYAGTMLRFSSFHNELAAGIQPTSGNLVWLELPYQLDNNANWNPASGNANFIQVYSAPKSALPSGSTASGYLNFLTWNPTVVSGATPDYRMIVSLATSGYDLYLTGGAKSRVGNLGVGGDADATTALKVYGSLATAEPSANGAGIWKFGKYLTGSALTVQTTKWIEVEIDGTLRKIPVLE